MGDHFPGFETTDYEAEFRSLCQATADFCGADISDLRGHPLHELPHDIAAVMEQNLAWIGEHVDRQKTGELVRGLAMEVADEFWRQHLQDLEQVRVNSIAGGFSHRSAVADYIIHAADLWDRCREDMDYTLCSRILTFPVESLGGELQSAPAAAGNPHEIVALIG